MDSQIFQYRELDHESQEIRVLVLLPSEDPFADIHCRLSYRNLGEKPFYEALSYMWGDPKDVETILLDNTPFHIRSNLFFALRQLRQKSGQRILWVDAVCINQNNEIERNSQVLLMGLIYSGSCQTIVWIGLEEEDSDVAIELLLEISKFVKGPDADDNNDRLMALLRTDETLTYSGRALVQLLIRPYWERVWIMQEVLLSPNSVVLCGSKIIAWPVMVKALLVIEDNADDFIGDVGLGMGKKRLEQAQETEQHLRELYELGAQRYHMEVWKLRMEHRFGTQEEISEEIELQIQEEAKRRLHDDDFDMESIDDRPQNGSNLTWDLARLYSQMKAGQNPSQLKALVAVRNRVSTNDHDRIYGLLSVVPSIGITPDYGKPVSLLYREVVKAYITSRHDLDILSACYTTKAVDDLTQFMQQLSQRFARSRDNESSITATANSKSFLTEDDSPANDIKDEYLHSWVPDWREDVDPEQYLLLADKRKDSFQASRDSVSIVQFPNNGLVMQVQGFTCGSVEHVSGELVNSDLKEYIRSDWEFWCLHTKGIATTTRGHMRNFFANRMARCSDCPARSKVYGGTRKQIEAFGKTLAFGQIPYEIFFEYATLSDPSQFWLSCTQDANWPSAKGRFFITSEGYMGRASTVIQDGDIIVILLGAKVPFVLRKAVDTAYHLVIECYIEGLMYGEAIDRLNSDPSILQNFTLI